MSGLSHGAVLTRLLNTRTRTISVHNCRPEIMAKKICLTNNIGPFSSIRISLDLQNSENVLGVQAWGMIFLLFCGVPGRRSNGDSKTCTRSGSGFHTRGAYDLLHTTLYPRSTPADSSMKFAGQKRERRVWCGGGEKL